MQLEANYHNTTKPERLMEIVDKVAAVVKKLREDNPGLTHIVAQGSSGQSVAWPVSYKLGIPVCIVRKPGEQSHAGEMSGSGDLGNYIIIDDLISTGTTLRRVIKAIADRHERSLGEWSVTPPMVPVCIGVVLYQDRSYTESGSFRVTEYGSPEPVVTVPVYGGNYSEAL